VLRVGVEMVAVAAAAVVVVSDGLHVSYVLPLWLFSVAPVSVHWPFSSVWLDGVFVPRQSRRPVLRGVFAVQVHSRYCSIHCRSCLWFRDFRVSVITETLRFFLWASEQVLNTL